MRLRRTKRSNYRIGAQFEILLEQEPQKLSKKLSFYQIQGGKTVKNHQIDPQTTDIWSAKINLERSIFDRYFMLVLV